jgi:hypothetical protein
MQELVERHAVACRCLTWDHMVCSLLDIMLDPLCLLQWRSVASDAVQWKGAMSKRVDARSDRA